VSVSQRFKRGILDTSTVILLARIEDPSSLPEEPLTTAVTLAELSVGPLVTDDPDGRAARQAHVQQLETDFEPSVVWPPRCGVRGVRPPRAPTTR
jgi:tRNA(fMet)-specific endonuclease VapC